MITKNRFIKLNEAVQACLLSLMPRILPQGKQYGHYWVSLNPTRHDRTLGSFKINLITGHWADYATGDSGSDVISLAAYLYGMKQGEAATYIENIMGVVANDN